jgi:hypothetical protein
MTVQKIVGICLFIISCGCTLRANLLIGDIVSEVNRLLPKGRVIPTYGFVRHRFFDILTEYRRLYPDGKLLRRLYIWGAMGFACWIGSVAYLFFSGAGSVGYIPRHR